jgi:AcrR family transcriptional regulator
VTKKGDLFVERKKNDGLFLKECMFTAFMQLLREKPLDEITITEITSRAGVSRMTFYRSFSSKEEIVRDYFAKKKEDFHAGAALSSINDGHIAYRNVLYCFTYLLSYGNEIKLLLRANMGNIVLDTITNYLLEFFLTDPSDTQRKYLLHSYAGSIYNTFVVWLLNGALEQPEQIARLIYDIYCARI